MADTISAPKLVADPHLLSREELIERLEASHQGGIRIDFAGKANARKTGPARPAVHAAPGQEVLGGTT